MQRVLVTGSGFSNSFRFTTNDKDTLYGKGFWSNFDMSNSEILKPMGEFNNFK